MRKGSVSNASLEGGGGEFTPYGNRKGFTERKRLWPASGEEKNHSPDARKGPHLARGKKLLLQNLSASEEKRLDLHIQDWKKETLPTPKKTGTLYPQKGGAIFEKKPKRNRGGKPL